jgi:CsoR family transcriptional regulator, copper-sensing transcriptional repressor
MLNDETEAQALARLKRIEGQIRGIAQMVDDRKYCIDILTQVSAARRALEKVALLIMQQHMRTCVTEAVTVKKGDPKIQEMIKTIDQFIR